MIPTGSENDINPALASMRRSTSSPDRRAVEWSRRAALLLPFSLAACASEVVEPPVSRRALDAVRLDPAEAVAWLNAYRAKSGLGPVRLDAELTALAQAQADAMASADKVSHDLNGHFSVRLASS